MAQKLHTGCTRRPALQPQLQTARDPIVALPLYTLSTMKFTAILAPLTLIPALASAVTLSYEPGYTNPSRSLNNVACSNGENGLITPTRTTLGSLPNFPNIGGTAHVASWNSDQCGTCWTLTYTNSKGVTRSVNVLAVDHANAGWNVATPVMDALTGGQAIQLGRIEVTETQVASSVCGL
ncbi:hypothetical protein H0H87_008565 [Tephrocybe sp. NHM501043]|nr:hypothetical protein H0H87_008565 [Tephrocybe sp. NHM501043]